MNRPIDLRWDWRDVARAARWGFSDRKIAQHARGVLLTYALFVILFYGTFMAQGVRFGDLWMRYGIAILPILRTFARFSRGQFALVAAGAIALGIFFYYGTAVAKLTFEQLRGEHFFPSERSRVFAGRHFRAALRTEFILVAIILIVRFLALIGGWIGRIPVVGEWWIAVGSLLIIPAFFTGLLLSLLVFITLAGLLLLPSIAGVSGETTTEVSYRLAAIVWREGWRLLAYEALLLLVALGAGAVFYAASYAGLSTMLDAVADGYPRFEAITHSAARLVWGAGNVGWIVAGTRFDVVTGLSLPMLISVGLTALGFLAVTIVLISYVLSIVSAGNTVIYISLHRRIWGDNLLESDSGDAADETANDVAESAGSDELSGVGAGAGADVPPA